MNRLWIISNYNQDPSSVITRLTAPFLVCNQGDPSHIPDSVKLSGNFKQTKHTGHNISDYLQFILENYNNLPESLGFAKGNIFPRHIDENSFVKRQPLDDFVPLYSDRTTFSPSYRRLSVKKLIAQQVAPGYYLEITNNWYVKHRKKGQYYPRINDLFKQFFRRDVPEYILFVPGACMIVPREKIVRWPIEVYQKLYEAVTYDFFPVEAFHVERSMLYFFNFPLE